MVQKGKTPLEHKAELARIVQILFSGLHEEKGKIKASSWESRFPLDKIYEAIEKLSKEFNFWYIEEQLEDVLFMMGAFGLVFIGGPGWRERIVKAETKRVILRNLIESHGEEKIREFLPMVKRFNELNL